MKIVVIGAGSRIFGWGQVVDTFRAEELKGRGVELCLVDVDEAALELMTRAAERLKEHLGSDITISSTTDRTKALPGAHYVIVAVTRYRMQLWEQDFRIPLAFGFNHVLGENGGPGALFHTMRNLELIVPISRDVEKYCPDALVLNFTNPESRMLHAMNHLTNVKAVGLCHGVYGAVRRLAEYLERPADTFRITSAGINHLYCVLSVIDNETGEELLPLALEKARQDTRGADHQIFYRFARIFDLFIFPNDGHTGEFLTFGSEFYGTQWRFGIERKRLPKDIEPVETPVEKYARGMCPPDDPEVTAPSGEIALPVICDIETDSGRRHPAVNVLNDDGYIENLPRDMVVEVPGTADRDGVHGEHVGTIPETFAAFIRPQCTINSVVTEAYRTRSRKLLLQALLLDPCVNSITQAEKLIHRMIQVQEPFLPKFS